LIWYRKECQEATKIIRRYHVILNALPEKAKVFSVEAEAALKRKLSDMYVWYNPRHVIFEISYT